MSEQTKNPNLLPGISIAGNAASGLFGIASTIINNRAQRRLAMDTYNLQRKDALADWERQTKYDSPAEQMKRYKEAGINPNMVYGNQSNSPVVRSTPMDVPKLQPLPAPDLGGAIAEFQSIKKQQAQTDLTEKVLGLQALKEQMMILDIAGKVTRNNASEFTLSQQKRNADLINSNLQGQLENLNTMVDKRQQEMAWNTETWDKRKQLLASKIAQQDASAARAIQAVVESKELLPYRKREAEARIGNILESTEGKKLQNRYDRLTMATRMTVLEYTMEYLHAQKGSTESQTALNKVRETLLQGEVDYQGVDQTLKTLEGIKDIINPLKGIAPASSPAPKGTRYEPVPSTTKPWKYEK